MRLRRASRASGGRELDLAETLGRDDGECMKTTRQDARKRLAKIWVPTGTRMVSDLPAAPVLSRPAP